MQILRLTSYPTRYSRQFMRARFRHYSAKDNPVIRGQDLNTARELLAHLDGSEEVVECHTVVSRDNTVIHSVEKSVSVTNGPRNGKQVADTFMDDDDPIHHLSGPWSRAGMLSSEYDGVNRNEEPYGRKEGAKDDLRYGCMEKYKRESGV
ncbi:hypothetical protein AMATHDRAFT_49940 [Amanita thiersii Skay4041]|uniref:Uncharacterized protein n=1 Tax=Amanita thiersii Skay4041 TaxID=703135 RepID=A0A2A9NI31_9AGAR|nr:hypothetical protein AMATHDRAFT_49940 [Amanita thiersii Skay4041]